MSNENIILDTETGKIYDFIATSQDMREILITYYCLDDECANKIGMYMLEGCITSQQKGDSIWNVITGGLLTGGSAAAGGVAASTLGASTVTTGGLLGTGLFATTSVVAAPLALVAGTAVGAGLLGFGLYKKFKNTNNEAGKNDQIGQQILEGTTAKQIVRRLNPFLFINGPLRDMARVGVGFALANEELDDNDLHELFETMFDSQYIKEQSQDEDSKQAFISLLEIFKAELDEGLYTWDNWTNMDTLDFMDEICNEIHTPRENAETMYKNAKPSHVLAWVNMQDIILEYLYINDYKKEAYKNLKEIESYQSYLFSYELEEQEDYIIDRIQLFCLLNEELEQKRLELQAKLLKKGAEISDNPTPTLQDWGFDRDIIRGYRKTANTLNESNNFTEFIKELQDQGERGKEIIKRFLLLPPLKAI